MAEWRISTAPVAYPEAMDFMQERADGLRAGSADECVWLLEHPPLYTAGTSSTDRELLDPGGLPVLGSGRGGRHTYHGPGQRVAYVMLDLEPRGRDVRRFVWQLEEWVIRALAEFGVRGEHRDGRPGVWVVRSGHEEKIAALGLRLRRWVSTHGIAVNVAPDMTRFGGIVPCGIQGHGVTSLAACGVTIRMDELDRALMRHFAQTLGRDKANGSGPK